MDATQGRPSQGLTELIGRALTDRDFRESLFRDRAKAVERYELSPADLEALDHLSRETLEEHARQFSEGDALALTIGIFIRIKF
jgi:hypothetical protein